MTFTCSLLLTAAIATAPGVSLDKAANVRLAALDVPADASIQIQRLTPGPTETWMLPSGESRPAALPVMYATLGALNALDVYSTRRALAAGGTEANPIMRDAAGNTAVMLAVKAASTAGTIYFIERAWKKNRKGAVVTMTLINVAMAAVTAHNLKAH